MHLGSGLAADSESELGPVSSTHPLEAVCGVRHPITDPSRALCLTPHAGEVT